MTHRALAGAILVVAVLAVGCSSEPPALKTGPFGNGGIPGSVCQPAEPGSAFTNGDQVFRNTGPAATITRVALADPQHLTLLAAWIVPVTGHWLYGNIPGWPPAPPGLRFPGVQWAHRQRGNGAVIPHTSDPHSNKSGENIVLVLTHTQRFGSAIGIDVFYRSGGQNYHMRTRTRILLADTTALCVTLFHKAG